MFFRTYLLDRESAYILVGDETVRAKSGDATYGLSRFFSSLHGKAVPGLSFLALSLYQINGICSARSPCLAVLTLSENFESS